MRDVCQLSCHILSAPVCTCVSVALDSQGSSSIHCCLLALLPQPWSTSCICTLAACMWFRGLTWAPVQCSGMVAPLAMIYCCVQSCMCWGGQLAPGHTLYPSLVLAYPLDFAIWPGMDHSWVAPAPMSRAPGLGRTCRYVQGQ